MKQWLWRVALAMGLAAGVAGCGGGDEAPPSASAVIGPDGGTLDGPDGVRVEIPPGALAVATPIRITRSDAGSPAGFPADFKRGTVYEFTPHGTAFAEPVTISLPSAADPAVRPVFMASPGEAWRVVSAESAGGRLRWQVTGFSWALQADACAIAAGTTDPYPCVWPSSFGSINATPSASVVDTSVSNDFRSFVLNQENSVDVRFHYSAARDCGDVRAEIRHWQAGVVDASGKLIVTSLKVQQSAALTPSSTNANRGEDDLIVSVPFSHADNGVHFFGMGFSCLRPGRTQRAIYGGQLRLSVETPAPPPGPALPTITQQPSNASVVEGTTANFDVLASAADSLSINWERLDSGAANWVGAGSGNSITGGGRFSLATQLADHGAQFRAQVCNTLNAQTRCLVSAAATLSVAAATTSASMTVLAGALNAAGSVDGTGSAARFDSPIHIAVDAAGNAYTTSACTVRKITPAGVATTLAGLANACTGSVDGTGAAARLHSPFGVAVDTQGNVYVAENFGAIRKITPAGVVSTLAGSDMGEGLVDGPGASALFGSPYGIAVDGAGNVYVADAGNAAIRKIDGAGNVSTVVSGAANGNPVLDGPIGTATLAQPRSIVVDAAGTLFFTEATGMVRKLSNGVVTTLAGSAAGVAGSADGAGADARFGTLSQITLDPAGNLYVADTTNNLIRKITPAGVVSTVIGVVGQRNNDLTSTPLHINFPFGVAAIGTGQLLLTAHPVVLRASVP